MPRVPVAGLAAATLAVAGLIAAWVRAARPRCFGVVGWVGVATFGACTALLASPFPKPSILVALAWSGYVLATDSAVFSLRGRSLIRSSPRGFVWLAALSIFLWLPFEWYNLHLAGWYRSGLPAGPIRYLLLGWSFACIWPALFETADLFLAVTRREPLPGGRCHRPRYRHAFPVAAVGAACLSVPLLVPRLDFGEHLLPLTGVGFMLVLDPLNAARSRASLWLDWSGTGRARVAALAAAGVFCGLIADGLTYMAAARWYSISSLGAGLTAFELPAAAYLVFAAFGPQAWAMHVFAAGILNLPSATVPSYPAEDRNDSSRSLGTIC